MLSVEDLHLHFGGIRAVDGVTLTIESNTITGLIGPNGAGKTSLFNAIAGVHPPTSGHIFLDQEKITGLLPHQLFSRGLVRTFQIAHEFSSLTVLENLMVVPGEQPGEQLLNVWFNPSQIRQSEERIRERAHEVLQFLKISHLENEPAGNLSGGQKKLLELGRTMMTEAKIVFLDEVGAGVNRTLLKAIGDSIQELNQEHGYTFCMIEHDIDFITRMCHPVIVMAEGKILAQGSAEEVKANREVIESYLGRKTTG
ncbi:MAG: ABC transporter ATP-binding protein [Gammaproteobacteria bacterium]|nr:ABC transporter ATP-binding protein [Gammaproteobacteria bacterium]